MLTEYSNVSNKLLLPSKFSKPISISRFGFAVVKMIQAGMCTRPSEPRPRRDPCLRDRDVQNFVRDETETRRCSCRDAGRDLIPGFKV